MSQSPLPPSENPPRVSQSDPAPGETSGKRGETQGDARPAPPGRSNGLLTALIGLGAGMVNGLLGVGGGIIMVPGLIMLKQLSPRVAVGTSLGAVFFMALAAFAAHLSLSGMIFGTVNVVWLLLAGAVGSQLGGVVLRYINQRWLLILFALLMELSAFNVVYKALSAQYVLGVAPEPPFWSFPLIGGFTGFFSGLLGIGGGGITLMAFAVFFHTPILEALPVGLLVNVANAASGVAAQIRSGIILWGEVLKLVPASLVGVALGVLLAMWLPADMLRVLFALFFMYMGWRLYQRSRKI